MNTVYQFGQAQLVNDIIMGWLMRANDNSGWMRINDMSSEVLKDLVGSTFPVYVPESFQDSIKKELEERLQAHVTEMEKIPAIKEEKPARDPELQAAQDLSRRQKDKLDLMNTILEKMEVIDGALTSKLDYVTVIRSHNGWSFVGQRGDAEFHPTINAAVDRIMARWW